MTIIQSWVDEKKVSLYASQLIEPHQSLETGEDDFIVTSSDQGTQIKKGTLIGELGKSQEQVDEMVASLTREAPKYGEEKIPETALKALQKAASKASSSGAITKSLKQPAVKSGSKKWQPHKVSAELQQHLGESVGAVVNPAAVTGVLEKIAERCRTRWGVGELCIADRDGDIFWDTIKQPAWSELTISVTEPIRLLDIKQGAIGHGYMHLKLTAESYLQVVVCSTQHGLLIFGMNRTKPLRPVEVQEFVDDLRSFI